MNLPSNDSKRFYDPDESIILLTMIGLIIFISYQYHGTHHVYGKKSNQKYDIRFQWEHTVHFKE